MIRTTIDGTAKVFRNDYNGRAFYKVSLSHKNQDGSWENAGIDIQFKKDVEVENGTEIELKRAWLDFYKSRKNNNAPVFFIRCIDFEVISGNAAPKADPAAAGFEIMGDDIPF